MEPPLKERARGAADNAAMAFAESLGRVIKERVTRPKYDDAVNIAMGVIDERIDTISKKAKQTQRDKDLLESLQATRSEMAGAFEDRWLNREDWVHDRGAPSSE